jgi:DhnA family fructose-bisphosphate aldolase class Ia
MVGKSLRLSQLSFPEISRFFLLPIDHGITYGPIQGIKDYVSIISKAAKAGVTGIILHKGLFNKIITYERLCSVSYILHLSASTCYNKNKCKTLVSSVEQAVKIGASGVSIQVNLGVENENIMLRDFGIVSEKCYEWGMPLLAMIYYCPSNAKISNIAHSVRIAEELGADMVKINYPGTMEEFKSIVKYSNIPVIIAGGEKTTDLEHLLTSIRDSVLANGAGVAIGRNIFQMEDPAFICGLIKKIIIDPTQYNDCIAELKRFHLNMNSEINI